MTGGYPDHGRAGAIGYSQFEEDVFNAPPGHFLNEQDSFVGMCLGGCDQLPHIDLRQS